MPATKAPSVTLTREDAIELLATLYAAASLFLYDEEDTSFEDARDDSRNEAIMNLYVKLCRRVGHDPGDVYSTDPTELELEARAQEIEADLIEAVVEGRRRNLRGQADMIKTPLRVKRLRLYAERLREDGADLDTVSFPSTLEVRDAR